MSIVRFSLWCIALAFGTLLQESGMLAIQGVSPNIVMLVFLLMFFTRESKLLFLLVTCVYCGIVLILFPFWILSSLLFLCIIGIVGVVRNHLTGSAFFDFILTCITGIIALYSAYALLYGHPFLFKTLLIEVVYTGVVGIFIWPMLYRLRGRE